MHLAVCDDHMVDRKQMERLLGRESDRRISTTGVLYVDSFGSKESILTTPMIYDAIFMDMTEEGCDAVELSNMLRADGTAVPIVFCCGKVDYRKSPGLPDNVLFMDKPITVDALSRMIDQLLSIKNQQVKKIEFRNRLETFYLSEDEILCAWPENDRDMRIRLFNGEERLTEMNSETFCGNLKDYDCFILLANRAVLNMLYVQQITFFKVTMLGGKQFRLSFGESRALERAVSAYRKKESGTDK
ncbi:MAG: response regulator [Eubacteriales bacterium]|nr:response regulator [Eubacteriales bacterium]